MEVRIGGSGLHKGEEPPLCGSCGAGVIFFSGCTLGCAYCQNHRLSAENEGFTVSCDELSNVMIRLQSQGAACLDLVTLAHYSLQILDSLAQAKKSGLSIPVVFNSGGYELTDTLQLWKNRADIYLVDMKYATPETSKRYSRAVDYVETNRKAVVEMYKQVGPLRINSDGIAISGLIVRHLILPGYIRETEKILAFLSHHVSRDIHISLMSQYFPAGNARSFPELNRRIQLKEKVMAESFLRKYNLRNGWVQSFSIDPSTCSVDKYI
jgi:putative pyruvate formate lyase activating enzyme